MYLISNIKLLRNTKNMTQEKFALELGVCSRGTVAKWESGKTVPDIFQIDAMAKFFGITIDDLVNKNLSVADADNITESQNVVFNLFEQFLKGNEIIMDLLDVKVISKALIKKIKEEASTKSGYDAAKIYMEAGSLGDEESYSHALSIFRDLMEKSSNEKDVDSWIMYKDLYDEVESKIMDIGEKEMEYMMMPYEEKLKIMDSYYVKKYYDEQRQNEILEENEKEIESLHDEYRKKYEEGDLHGANSLAFYNNKLVDATYKGREDLKLEMLEE